MKTPRPILPKDAATAWARIEPRLNKSSGCWVWTGIKNAKGYGRVGCGGKTRRVHRVAFAHFKGDTEMHLDHTCRNHACCNPDHLEPVTIQENVARGTGSASWALRDGTCKRGHPLIDGSYRVTTRGRRQCRECVRQWGREAHARNPEKNRARWQARQARKRAA